MVDGSLTARCQVRDYIWDTIQLLPKCMNDTKEQKAKMQQVVLELLSIPAKYQAVFGDVEPLMPICFAVDTGFQLISTKVQWLKPLVVAQTSTGLAISITSHGEHPIPVAAIEVVLSNTSLNRVISDKTILEPELEARFILDMELEHIQELKVELLRIHLGEQRDKLRLDFSVAPPLAAQSPWVAATPLAKLQAAELHQKDGLVTVPLSSELLERPVSLSTALEGQAVCGV